jgi:MFS family permease
MTVAAATPRGARLNHLDFAVLALYWVAIGYLWTSLGTLILPGAVREIVGSARQGTALSVLEGIGTVVAVVWQPIVGTMSDRTRSRWGRRRPFIFTGTVGDVLFLLGLALSGSFWPLVVFYTLLQLASNTAQGPYQGLAPDVVPVDQRGTASGFYGLANLLGVLAGTLVAGYIQSHAGRPAAVLSIALFLVVTMLVTVLCVPERPDLPPARVGSPLQLVLTTFGTPLRYPPFLWLMGSRLLILMGIVGIQSFAFFYFADAFFHGDSRATTNATAYLVGLVVLLAILVTWPAARLSDRIGRKPMVVIGGSVATGGVLILLFSGYRWLPDPVVAPMAAALAIPKLAAQTLAAGILIGIGFGSFFSVDWAFITDVIPTSDEAGLFFGFSNIATAGSGVIARFTAGPLLDHFNAGPHILSLPGGYPVIFGIFVVWLIVGTLLILPVRVNRGSAIPLHPRGGMGKGGSALPPYPDPPPPGGRG